MDQKISRQNLWLSVKKYFTDNIETALGIKCIFGSSFSMLDTGLDRWVAITKGRASIGMGKSVGVLNIFVCTRRDPEGDALTELLDIIIDNITDTNQEGIRSFKSIPFYDTTQSPWVRVTSIMINPDTNPEESEMMTAEDDTNFVMIAATMEFFS